VFQLAATQRAPERIAPPKPAVVEEPATVIEREEGVVSLEEVEEPDLETDVEGDEAVVPGVEGEEEIEAGEDDTFLQEEEEEGEDVSGLLDVDAEEDDER
jgi:hypothetical protein